MVMLDLSGILAKLYKYMLHWSRNFHNIITRATGTATFNSFTNKKYDIKIKTKTKQKP